MLVSDFERNDNHDEGGDPSLLWENLLAAMREDLDPQIYSAYLESLVLVQGAASEEQRPSVLTIGAPSRFVCLQVQKNFGDKFLDFFRSHLGEPLLTINYTVVTNRNSSGSDKSLKSPAEGSKKTSSGQISTAELQATLNRIPIERAVLAKIQSAERSEQYQSGGSSSPTNSSSEEGSGSNSRYVVVKRPVEPSRPPIDLPESNDLKGSGSPLNNVNLNGRYTFDTFVVGNSNQFCHAAAMRVAEKPGQNYNPLFIYGGVGLGKTHLLHSIGNEALRRNPRANVLYLSSEAFTNELIQSLRHAKMEEFKSRLRRIEVLLIDDIQFICGKERTQEEFFHTFNALYSARHQIVITSDKIPSEIPGIEERLQTRFSWGLTADIQAPDFETRVAILKRKASLENFSLAEDVAHMIAEKVSSNVRELEGALTRVHAICSLKNIPITLPAAVIALEPLLQTKPVNISVDDIKRAVAQHFNLKVLDMVSKRRTKNLSFPRHIAMYLCRKHTTCSYPEIGNQFGGRDHSSVIHAANVVSTKVTSDTQVRELIEEIERRLLER